MTLLQIMSLPVFVYIILKVNNAVNFQVDVNHARREMEEHIKEEAERFWL